MTGSILGPYDLGVALVVLVAIVVLVIAGRRIALRWGTIEAKVDGIDKAVNNRPAGEPTLYEQVRVALLKLDDNSAATHATSRRVTELAALLTAHIAHHQAEDDQAARG